MLWTRFAGGLQLVYKNEAKTRYIRYDHTVPGDTCRDREASLLAAGGEGVLVEIEFNLPTLLRSPVYVFFQIEDYVSGHKRFQRSRDNRQIAGEASSIRDPVPACRPQAYLGSDSESRSPDLPNGGAIAPCGLIGWSQFNDSFKIHNASGPFKISEEGIAWASDREYLFGDYEAVNYNTVPALRGGATAAGKLSDAEHLIVWFRPSAKSDITYRWGTILEDLGPGNYNLTVQNRYNTYGFCARKSLVLSTNTWDGGSHKFLSIVYLFVGSLYSLTLTFFLVAFFGFRRRESGNVADLSWAAAPAFTLPAHV